MFNFDDAKVETGSNFKYIQPGIEEVTLTKIETGKNSVGNDYLEITVTNKGGATCNNRYSLSTTVREGATKAAWTITKDQLFQVLLAAGNAETKVKTVIGTAKTAEELAESLSTLLIGKKVRMKFNGEEKEGKTPGKTWVLTKFGTGYFAESISVSPSKLFYSETKNIKRLPNTPKVEAVTEEWTN